jgi:hypothetical protein
MFEVFNYRNINFFFKSGMLVDFCLKKFFLKFLFIIFFYCVFFTEKYFVEYFFLQASKYIKIFYIYSDSFSNESFFGVFGLLIFVFVIVLFLV